MAPSFYPVLIHGLRHRAQKLAALPKVLYCKYRLAVLGVLPSNTSKRLAIVSMADLCLVVDPYKDYHYLQIVEFMAELVGRKIISKDSLLAVCGKLPHKPVVVYNNVVLQGGEYVAALRDAGFTGHLEVDLIERKVSVRHP